MFELPIALLITLTGLVALALGWFRYDDAVFTRAAFLRKAYPQPTGLFRLLSWTPFPVLMLFVLPGAVWLIRGDTIEAAALALSCTLALGLAFLGKFTFMRARPAGRVTYIGKVDSSFPSAHTAGPFAAAFILADVFVSTGLVFAALGFACLVALSRIWLQMHFLSDIAGGFLVAYAAAYFVTQSSFLPFILSPLGLV